MCRFLCSASAYQPPTVGEQYFRGRNSDRKGAKSHAVRRVRQTSKSGLAGVLGPQRAYLNVPQKTVFTSVL